MFQKIFIGLQVFLLCGLAQAEEIPGVEWSSLNLKLEGFKDWGTKSYSFAARAPGSKESKVLGTVSLVTELTEDAVILRDSFQMVYNGEKLSLKMTYTCRKDVFLSPDRIESKGEGEEVQPFMATVTKGEATVISDDGNTSTRELPEGTITTAAMMRLVTLVPRTPGKTYAYKYSLEAEELNLKKDYTLSVMEPETITRGERQVKCSKFQMAGGGISPAYFWVSEDGVLQRVMLDDRKVMDLKSAP